MNKYVMMLAAAGLIAAAPVYYAVSAQAEDAAPAAEAAADHADHAAEAAPETLPTTPPAAEPVKEAQLADGTNIVIDNGHVSVVAADGAMTPAPDGEHTLNDGTKIKTVGGKIVTE